MSKTRVKSVKNWLCSKGGLNLPKIIECEGSDGQRYKQLVKGRDDMRQDAVMQQMFSMVNVLLKENPETRKRRLNIKGYKIIPMTPAAGLLEWVMDSMPIGSYLVGSIQNPKVGAHYRYRPLDLFSLECRKELTNAAEGDKLTAFKSIMEKFHPVFHHFFLEHYLEPHEVRT